MNPAGLFLIYNLQAIEMSPTLIYLHGFNSTPNSVKARQMTDYLAQELPDIQVCVPKLPNTPAASWQAIQETLAIQELVLSRY